MTEPEPKPGASGHDMTARILFGVIVLLILLIGFSAGRACAPRQVPVDLPGGIDAGPGDEAIAARLDASLREGDRRLAQIERKFEEDIARFDAQQRDEYERLRADAGIDQVAEFLRDWNMRRMRPE